MGRDKHLDCIDGIKGLGACIIAFLWHYQHFIMPPDVPLYRIFPVLYENGYIFVELFWNDVWLWEQNNRKTNLFFLIYKETYFQDLSFVSSEHFHGNSFSSADTL